jgi:hypothetical protein
MTCLRGRESSIAIAETLEGHGEVSDCLTWKVREKDEKDKTFQIGNGGSPVTYHVIPEKLEGHGEVSDCLIKKVSGEG